MKPVAAVGGILGFLGVAFGAFGAHALKDQLSPEMLAIYQTAVQYQLIHALLLVGIGLSPLQGRVIKLAGWLIIAGVVIFSGSLYALALTGTKVLGAITPFGGLCFLAGWAALAIAAGRQDPK